MKGRATEQPKNYVLTYGHIGSLKEFEWLQVPKRIYSLEELLLNKIEAEKFLSPADETLNTVRTVLQVSPALMRADWCS